MKFKQLKVREDIEIEKVEDLLFSLGYQKNKWVVHPGEFSVRGGTVDIYPLTYRIPVRLQFRGTVLETIRDFSPVDGKGFTSFEEVFIIPLSKHLQKKIKRIEERFESFVPVSTAKNLQFGDFVVHSKYGIGKFLGTKAIQIEGKKERYFAIEYANKEILYLSMNEPLERYIGGCSSAPKLTKLHTKEWDRIKQKTRVALHSVAGDLLKIQAKRSVSKGISFAKDHEWQKDFEAEFPFEETAGQKKAIEEVKNDMESSKPMDRLLCGDVGYGKTEVAMRAAFKSVLSGRQVAILVPTTLLAEQHYLLLKKRTENYPIVIEILSRFQSFKKQRISTQSIKSGKADIVIGTHRLLSKDIKFKNLGLIIIDEEQRFGVRHKEKLKKLKSIADVLTLTATPIPRTLHMALLGTRDMSIIDTPPENRLPIKTHVMEYHGGVIKEAILREIKRGGQVYFVHNRVESIDKIHEKLKVILPEIKFGIAHGQMKAMDLEKVMEDFLEKKIDCLIATSIIESGIDIPNVNTLIINRADSFGLSDLYQLRGRVGRFWKGRQAYAYFFVPKNWMMTMDAKKRLTAIERFTELGSGFKIAMEDLEIRGAGNLLGHEQSGFIHAIGFDLYCKMLKKTIEEEKRK